MSTTRPSSTVTATAPDPGPPPRRRPSAWGWVLVAVGALLGLLTVVAVASTLVGALARGTATGGEVVEGVSSVEVVNDCAGDVDVRAAGGGSGSAVDVSWRDRSALFEPEHRQVLTRGALLVEVGCPAFSLGWSPTSDLALLVPDGAPVSVRTGSGDVSATGLTASSRLRTGSGDVEADDVDGDLVLRTGSGEVRARDVSGDVTARTGSGDVELVALSADRVEVATGSGDVVVGALRPPLEVAARAGSGDLDVVVPEGGAPYAVDASSGSGEVEVGVADDPSSSRTLVLRTGSGDIAVQPAP